MKISLKESIDQLKRIEKEFNKTDSPTRRYALLMALKHVALHLPLSDYWEEQYRQAMLIETGIDPRELTKPLKRTGGKKRNEM